MKIDKLIQLLRNFEKRNNISIELSLYSDRSISIKEFWDGEILKESKYIEEIEHFLKNIQYKLDDNGRCISPVIIIE